MTKDNGESLPPQWEENLSCCRLQVSGVPLVQGSQPAGRQVLGARRKKDRHPSHAEKMKAICYRLSLPISFYRHTGVRARSIPARESFFNSRNEFDERERVA